jgi:hypothetical protein
LLKRDWNAEEAQKEKSAETARKKGALAHELNRRKDTKPSRELAAYTGAYEEPAYGVAMVSLENGRLALRWVPSPRRWNIITTIRSMSAESGVWPMSRRCFG